MKKIYIGLILGMVLISGAIASSNLINFNTQAIPAYSLPNFDSWDKSYFDDFNPDQSSDIIPALDEVYDLGSPEKKWKDLYLSNATIYLGSDTLSTSDGEIVFNNESIAIKEEVDTYKMQRADNGTYETASAGVEYISPDQHGGYYGTIYRQYFNTTLPSSLTTGGNVANLIFWTMQATFSDGRIFVFTGRHVSISATHEIDLRLLTDGNLQLGITGFTLNNGWVDYTK